MKILFVCKHNRFRSKVAEAIFNKLNKNKMNKALSAGIIIDKLRPYVAKNVIRIMNDKDYKIKGRPKQITKNLVDKFDLLVIVADNVDKKFFNDFKGKIIKWDISDSDESDIKKIKRIIENIETKVNGLIKDLI